jgi:tetratricopeptide (TPR) repeat protein
LICVGLVGVTVGAYEGVRRCGFVWDDAPYVSQNPQVQAGLTREGFGWAFESYIGYWHPVVWLSHMLDCELFGLDPAGHHLVNIGIHTANVLLLFLVLWRMTGAVWTAGVVAAVFAVHPLNVEAVAWVSSRKDVLSTLFWMLTLAAYLWYARKPGVLRYLLVVAPFVVGLMTKPMLVTLPVVLLILDYWPLARHKASAHRPRRLSPGFKLFIEKMPFILLAFASICISSISAQHVGVVVSTQQVPMGLRVSNALVSYVKYVADIFYPENLAAFYPFPEVVPLLHTAGAAVALVCVSAIAIRLARRMPYLPAGWLWYLVTLLPVAGLVQAGNWPAMADRFVYVPGIGIFIMVVFAARQLLAKGRLRGAFLAISGVLMVTALVMRTRTQVRYWTDEVTLYDRAAKVTEKNYLVLCNLAHVLRLQGRYAEAEQCYRQVIEINPGHADAHNNLGAFLLKRGELDAAIDHFRKSLRFDPNDPGVHYNIGRAYAATGDVGKAASAYRAALDLNPDLVGPLTALAWILATSPQQDLRDPVEAVRLAGKAVQMTNHGNASVVDTLAAAYAAAGRFDDAVYTARSALGLAESTGEERLAEDIGYRLGLYKMGRPYSESSPR